MPNVQIHNIFQVFRILFRIYIKKRFVDRFISIVKKNFLINNDMINELKY